MAGSKAKARGNDDSAEELSLAGSPLSALGFRMFLVPFRKYLLASGKLKSDMVELRRLWPGPGESPASDEGRETREMGLRRIGGASSTVTERRRACPGVKWLRPELVAEKGGKAEVFVENRGEVEEGGGDGRAAGASSDLMFSMLQVALPSWKGTFGR